MKTKLAILSLSVLFASACSSDAQVNHVAKHSDKQSKDYIGKVTAPIDMSYELSKAKYAVGENIELKINLTSKVKKPIMTQLNASKNLQQLSTESHWSVGLNKSGLRENQPTLSFVAEKEGLFYLDFVASIEVDGKMIGKAFSIPVQVGNASMQKPENVEVDEKGQKVKVYKLKDSN